MTMSATWFLAALALAIPGEKTLLGWRGRDHATTDLPAELPESARAAILGWSDWCAARDYRMDLDDDARVLFISRESNERLTGQLAYIKGCVARFEAELPAPARRPDPVFEPEEEPAEPKAPREKLPEDPEDPESGPHPWKLQPPTPERKTVAPTVTTWGKVGAPPDSETVVLVLARSEKDFERVLAHLAELAPYLAEWSFGARALQGFVIGEPLAGAYLESPQGVEEWNPDNELVNRVTRLLLLRRFGELPNWFIQAYAWHMEFAVKGGVYCFPWRDEFVWATEHFGWEKVLADWFEREDVHGSDFLGWPRGRYDDRSAKVAWGVVEYLLAHERARTPGALEDLRAHRELHSRIREGPTGWRRDPEYTIPTSQQEEMLTKAFGADLFARVTVFLREGMEREGD